MPRASQSRAEQEAGHREAGPGDDGGGEQGPDQGEVEVEALQSPEELVLIEAGEKILDGSMEKIREDFPLRSVKVVFADGAEPPLGLTDVTASEADGDGWRLTLREGADVDGLLDRLRAHGSLTLFSANRPSLQEIFLAAVRRRRAGTGEEVAS